jgi:hypothetical protein
MLEELTGKGYLRLQVEEGIRTYALAEGTHASRRNRPCPRPNARRKGAEAAFRRPERAGARSLDPPGLGRTNSEIANDLFVAVGTVKSHVNNIYNKLEVRNRTEAVARARELELLP